MYDRVDRNNNARKDTESKNRIESDKTGGGRGYAFSDNRPETKTLQALQLKIDKSTRTTMPLVVQRLTYKGHYYSKEDAGGFKSEALEDLGSPMNEDKSVKGAVSALAAHDENAVIEDVEALRKMLTLGEGDEEALILKELKLVKEVAPIIRDNAGTALTKVNTQPFQDKQKGEVNENMVHVEGGMRRLDEIEFQSRNYTDAKATPPVVKQEANDKTIVKSPSLLNKLFKWARKLPQIFETTGLRWQALGALGLTKAGRSHLNIGPKTITKGLAHGGTEEAYGTLWATPWTPGVNDAWIKAGKKRSLDFHIVSNVNVPVGLQKAMIHGDMDLFVEEAKKDAELYKLDPKKSYFWNRDKVAPTRLGGEILELLEAGYRLQRND